MSRNHLKRARWLLERGADAQTLHYYAKRKVHTVAQLHGYPDMAALLRSYGATPERFDGYDAFVAACMSLDSEHARQLVQQHPEFLHTQGRCWKRWGERRRYHRAAAGAWHVGRRA